MKARFFLSLLIGLALAASGFAASTYHSFSNETVDSIQIRGAVTLISTRVLGLIEVNGSLEAETSMMNSLLVYGRAHLKNSTVSKRAIIQGALLAENSNFNILSVSAEKITLDSCEVQTLVVHKVKGYDGIQTIELTNGTEIKGPIVVTSGKGQIWLTSGSTISDKVSGAKIIRDALDDENTSKATDAAH
jgi:hypothetical protein